MRYKMNRLFATLMFCVSMTFFISVLSLSNTSAIEARDNNCKIKNCELDKITCSCCLLSGTGNNCIPCGGYSC
jgi:hypothetical protein